MSFLAAQASLVDGSEDDAGDGDDVARNFDMLGALPDGFAGGLGAEPTASPCRAALAVVGSREGSGEGVDLGREVAKAWDGALTAALSPFSALKASDETKASENKASDCGCDIGMGAEPSDGEAGAFDGPLELFGGSRVARPALAAADFAAAPPREAASAAVAGAATKPAPPPLPPRTSKSSKRAPEAGGSVLDLLFGLAGDAPSDSEASEAEAEAGGRSAPPRRKGAESSGRSEPRPPKKASSARRLQAAFRRTAAAAAAADEGPGGDAAGGTSPRGSDPWSGSESRGASNDRGESLARSVTRMFGFR